MSNATALKLAPVEALGSVPPGVPPKAKRIRAKLKTRADLLAFMGSLVRSARSGLISPDSLAKYASAIQVMKSLMDDVSTDEKIAMLEKALANRAGGRP